MKPLIEGTFVEKDPAVMHWLPVGDHPALRGARPRHYRRRLCHELGGERVVTDLRNAMFAKLLALPAAFYEQRPSGTLISKLTFDVTQVTPPPPAR